MELHLPGWSAPVAEIVAMPGGVGSNPDGPPTSKGTEILRACAVAVTRDVVPEAKFLHFCEMKAEVKIDCSDKKVFRTKEGEDTKVAQLAKIVTSEPNFLK